VERCTIGPTIRTIIGDTAGRIAQAIFLSWPVG
jgi:hypothetical protein